MASVVTACYQCGAPVPAGAAVCPGCGAAQNEVAYARWETAAPLLAALKTARVRTATALIVGVVAGAAFGLWLGGASTAMSSRAATSATGQQFTRDQALSLFVPNAEQLFLSQKTPIRLAIKGWTYAKDSAVVLQLDSVTSDWRLMDDQSRITVTGLLAAGYDQALRAGGIPINTRKDGFPVVYIVYLGRGQILASRAADGKIFLYDSVNQSAPVPASTPLAPQPTTPAAAVPTQP